MTSAPSEPESPTSSSASTSTNPPSNVTGLESAVAALSLEEKVGQLFVAGFDGLTPTGEIEELVAERNLGGIIYFSRNVESPEQVRTLSRTLQGFVPEELPPLFVTIDQEGGRVARLSWGTELPSAMALGAADDPELAAQAGNAVGRELRSLGIDIDLAPVLDVNNNPDNPVIGVRSFGEHPERVAELGADFAGGLQDAGVRRPAESTSPATATRRSIPTSICRSSTTTGSASTRSNCCRSGGPSRTVSGRS
ncbi:glycoside hydrolase family 3 N-terminal domain-containing protein [Haladaptatus sp. R4]|uniref:glycoside hydrolase family 3 N-terminal domain-containing protein n=1 Tax=Haladaptatus sp. R4 TaxID=1679489 RepID=UPI000ACC54EA|nr:glycoside hydrolase family 3 N-terminal domain-containing protein [Haladaptatus sp. R4]